MGTVHSGTHIDALSHITCGDRSGWFGGGSAERDLGDFGPLRDDATDIPPIITRGVLIDVAGPPRCRRARRARGRSEPRSCVGAGSPGHASCARATSPWCAPGYLSGWPDADFIAAHEQAGIDRDAALLAGRTGRRGGRRRHRSLQVLPSTVPGNPHPVHIALLVDRGIFILEMVNCEELARDRVYEFCFVCLPLSIRGATGSMVRPVAVV